MVRNLGITDGFEKNIIFVEYVRTLIFLVIIFNEIENV
jgi:hypothetical protein